METPSVTQDPDVERDFWERAFDDRPEPRRGHPAASTRAGREPPPRPAFVVERASLTERLLDRCRGLRGDPRAGVVVLVIVAVVAGFVWYRIGIGDGGDAPPSAERATVSRAPATSAPVAPTAAHASNAASSASASSSSPKSGTIVVHVAGAVVHAGVVELGPGARVIDALEAVGGALPEADLDRLNLAARVADGERVFVAKVGQADPGAVGGGTSGGANPSPSARVNLNTATQAQLEALPGIGPALAQAILAERQARGGFRSVNELRGVRGIGDARFAQLEPLVTV